MILRWVTTSLLLLTAASAQSPTYLLSGEWIPFFSRVDSHEFQVIEKKLGQHYLENSLLVIYYSDGEQLLSRKLVLSKDPEHGYVLTYEGPSIDWKVDVRRSVILPKASAEKLLRTVEFVMTNQVFSPISRISDNFSTNPSNWTTMWVALGPGGEDAAGLIQFARCGFGKTSENRFADYIDWLRRCALNDQSEKSPLVQLELAGLRLLESYPKPH